MNKIFAILILLLLSPVFLLLYFVVKMTSTGPFIFKQSRMGKNKKPFTMYKIRTMIENAEKLQTRYSKLNEADGPVFKIKNDPRYTSFGIFLSKTALDETPQLINVVLGNMALVGPRPLPINEAKQISKKYQERFTVLPGMTSSWIVTGAHKLTFNQWMNLDLEYIKKKSVWFDIKILVLTLVLLIKTTLKSIFGEK